ncbi:DUF2567 domain-containing protein [Streptomyces sp. P9(2023)]|uniref:DUF2567 domain-containing protein n=1 Tax=Streptomyces sp. P9(2023) TaxID=3064394 RepID=UPI0028F40531|nr:DUF2567 domain-containing protein [Streptomyces sp. P9(2023)]MDT9687900.1 DUF2567 domain-containing protein [Streptomyces sp. P9(2023)]
MTAPLTPPHQPQQPHEPPNDAVPPHGWPAPYPPSPADDGGPSVASELRQAVVVAAISTVAGVALGLLWLWLAPKVPLISDGKAVFLRDSEGESAVGADGTFVLLALGFGVVAATLVFLVHRHGGVALVLALAAGGVLGSLLGWGVGTFLGPTRDVVAHAREVGANVVFDAPLKLEMWAGALLAWPLAAMIVHLALTAVFGPRDPDPTWPPQDDAKPATPTA